MKKEIEQRNRYLEYRVKYLEHRNEFLEEIMRNMVISLPEPSQSQMRNQNVS